MPEVPTENGRPQNGQGNLFEKFKTKLERLITEIREANIWLAICKKDREEKPMPTAKLDACEECGRLFMAAPGETLCKICRENIKREEGLIKPKEKKHEGERA